MLMSAESSIRWPQVRPSECFVLTTRHANQCLGVSRLSPKLSHSTIKLHFILACFELNEWT
jgi:hypothetical protein